MNDRRLGWVVVLAVGVAAVRCGANMGGGGGPSSPSEFFAQFCEIYRPCCQAAGLRGDGSQCRALYAGLAPTDRYDATAAAACLNATRAAASQPGFCEGRVADAVECSRVFQLPSGKAPGETCSEGVDCAPSSEGAVACVTQFNSGTETLKCQIEIKGAMGSSPCTFTVDGNNPYQSGPPDDIAARAYACYVSDGLRCDETTNACVAVAGLGGSCTGSTECVTDAFCDTTTSKCVERRSLGGACDGSSYQCVATAYCDSNMTCAARAAAGAACAASAQCISDSCVSSVCEAGSGNALLASLCGQP